MCSLKSPFAEIPAPQVMLLGSGPLGGLDHKGGAPVKGISALIKRSPRAGCGGTCL
jgi:hypothetical protein